MHGWAGWRLRIARLFVLAIVCSTCVACDAIVDRVIRNQATTPPVIDPDDGDLHVVLCGTGSPLPDPERAASCTAVIAGGRFMVFDTGPGAWENLQVWGTPIGRVSDVLLTHFHSDHMGELGEVVTQSWIASGRDAALPVYGPPGVDEVVEGFNRAYSHDRVHREDHHTAKFMPASGGLGAPRAFEMPSPGEQVTIIDDDGLTVTAFVVDHTPVVPAVGYRVEFGGRSVVISGDTAPSPSLVAAATGADMLIHEALSFELVERISNILGEAGRERQSHLANDILDYHTSPTQAKALADEAGVDLLVLTHNVPPLRNRLVERIFARDLDMNGVVIGDDGMHFVLPADGGDIEQGSLR